MQPENHSPHHRGEGRDKDRENIIIIISFIAYVVTVTFIIHQFNDNHHYSNLHHCAHCCCSVVPVVSLTNGVTCGLLPSSVSIYTPNDV